MTNDEILAQLAALESQKQIKIIYACESGSRAWGFPSPDSDYDIRFLYVRPQSAYLSVFPGKDVIDLPIDGDSDMGGWDVQKAFALLRKSNAALIEWLSSPIVYREDSLLLGFIKDLMASSFLAGTACHHYLSMAKKKIADIQSQDRVKLKSYFYALRATLCANFIVDTLSPPPMQIDGLIERYLTSDLKSRYDEMLARKLKATESYREPRQKWLDQYLLQKQFALADLVPVNQKKPIPELYNTAFQGLLNKAWN